MIAVLTVNGHHIEKAVLHVPAQGPWFIDCDMADDATDVVGKVTIAFGATSLVGTIDPEHNGVFAAVRKVRVVAGGNGWSQLLPAKDYHNDANVKARLVATDAAAAVGETISAFAGGVDTLDTDYVRHAGVASRVLEDAARGAQWWVAYDGTTHVGKRTAAAADKSTYELLDYNPMQRWALLSVDELSSIVVGSTITDDRLDAPLTVSELELTVDTDVRVRAWCGNGRLGDLADTMRGIVERLTDAKLHGTYKYRVVEMAGERVNLQVVRKATGLPDLLCIDMASGVAGAHATLSKGAIVGVSFWDGDRSDPFIAAFGGRGSPAQAPVRLDLGGATGVDVALKGGTVNVLLPPMVFVGTVGGAPATGVLSPMLATTLGTIVDGSSKVGAAP